MKIVFFTANTGVNNGFVNHIKQEMIPEFDYYYLHDGNADTSRDTGWNYLDIRQESDCPEHPGHRQRFAKIMSHRWFPDADWTVYLDQKWYIHKSFYQTILDLIIQNPEKQFMVPSHDANRTLLDEIMFVFDKGSWSVQESIDIANRLIELGVAPKNFISTQTALLVRKNTEEVIEANELWYNLIKATYLNHPRDQVVFPYCGAPLSLINNFNGILEGTGAILDYPPNDRHILQEEAERREELLEHLSKIVAQ